MTRAESHRAGDLRLAYHQRVTNDSHDVAKYVFLIGTYAFQREISDSPLHEAVFTSIKMCGLGLDTSDLTTKC